MPCRIVCHFDGIEWFAYNRSPAYDVLNDILTTSINNGPDSDQSSYLNLQTDKEITGEYFFICI